MNNASYIDRVYEYKNYIDTHRENIMKAFSAYGKDLCSILNINYADLEERLADHDASKYSKEEFEGFRAYYFPTLEEELDIENRGLRKKQYDAAWLHHLRNNAHHPEFWMYMDDKNEVNYTPMDKIHVAEMLLDWAAMGIFFKKTAYEYWFDSIHVKPLHNSTRALIDFIIHIFKENKIS